jgi:hypothetical protein
MTISRKRLRQLRQFTKVFCHGCAAVPVEYMDSGPRFHEPGQLILRLDVRHQPDCPWLRRFSPGFKVYPDDDLCTVCQTELWWDRLQDNVIRVEARHADDCGAESASSAELALMGVAL